MLANKKDIINQLRQNILRWEGFKSFGDSNAQNFGLGPIENSFPNQIFPTGTIHEFLTPVREQAAASGGFIGALLGKLMQNGGISLWISTSRTLFPPALKAFGVEPDRIIFVDLKKEKDVLWATEEALKCEGLTAVITELRDLTFAQSRRLQLAVEKSKVTGFILRSDLRKLTSTACVARWQITSIPSEIEDDMPGVGFPRWQIELLKVRNGNPGIFQLGWSAGRFVQVQENDTHGSIPLQIRKTG
jgi:protein ImuA